MRGALVVIFIFLNRIFPSAFPDMTDYSKG